MEQEESTAISLKSMIQAVMIVDMKENEYTQIKRIVKMPMILMTIIAGVIAGLSASTLKGMTIAVAANGFVGWALVYLTVALFFATLQLKSLNIAMENYDQIDIDPIYQASIILFNMLSGAIILNEKEMYEHM